MTHCRCACIAILAMSIASTQQASASDVESKGPSAAEHYEPTNRVEFGESSFFRHDPNSPFYRQWESRFRNDVRETPRRLFEESAAMLNWRNGAILGTGAALAAISNGNWDDNVRNWTSGDANRWGGAGELLNVVGHPLTHFVGTSAVYAGSYYFDCPEARDVSLATFDALLLTNSTVFVMKYMFNTRRPNGEPRGFPSGHVASSFAIASVIDEFEGPYWGIGAYSIAGLVAWQRIDSRKHDLSDVLFGAALGTAIGSTVAREHLFRSQNLDWRFGYDPVSDTTGVQLTFRY